MKFKLVANFQPQGDQISAIKKLVSGYYKYPQQTLLGVTGSGKTFTMANLIAQIQKPTLVLAHNKTLAAQLYNEFAAFFPNNKVCYFVSYYDYYQPESYMPQTDTYIEKDVLINEKIERLRLATMEAVQTRRDTIVVASVSCIYGLGNPAEFQGGAFKVIAGKKAPTLRELARNLVNILYERNDVEIKSGRFRLKGGTLDLVQGSGEEVLRFQYCDDQLQNIFVLHSVTGKKIKALKETWIFPAKAFVTSEDNLRRALASIRQELEQCLPALETVEAYRLRQRTNYDLEMIEQLGHCKGIENYSRHFDGRRPGQPPYVLLNYFPQDFLMIVDESHVALPQVRGMYEGDKARKKNLIDYGWRLPSAYDNRPLKFFEFEKYLRHVVYTSATPSDYEIKSSGQVVEQIIRPTGLVDPPIEVRSTTGQVEDLLKEVERVVALGYRILVTTLTKRMAEELTAYLRQQKVKAEYLHSEIETLERTEIIKRLRWGKFDVLVGINLLREGLDLPEVALVAILDADKEGFLRNARSLIQTIGRAARNVESKVIMYADKTTESMKEAIWETNRRREIQLAYNQKHKITPQSIIKAILAEEVAILPQFKGKEIDLEKLLVDLESQMQAAAEDLDFEKAIELRDRILELKEKVGIK